MNPGLEFGLGETIEILRETVANFAAREIAPRAAEIDRDNEFPHELWRSSAISACSASLSRRSTAAPSMGYLAHVVAMEEISRASASVGLSYGAHSNLCVNQIRRNGSERRSNVSAEADLRRARRRARDERSRARAPTSCQHAAARRAAAATATC